MEGVKEKSTRKNFLPLENLWCSALVLLLDKGKMGTWTEKSVFSVLASALFR